MRQLTLYSTSHCTLCEQALDLLFNLNLTDVRLHVIDVALDDDLLLQYGERIPVLQLDGVEYGGPMQAGALSKFLRAGQSSG